MQEINKLRIIYKLKSIYRSATVENRQESSAEHSWSSLILADFFLNFVEQKINSLKVYELLMYHDLVEVYAGDTILHPKLIIDKKNKKNKEYKSALLLREGLPFVLNKKYFNLYSEYEEQKTIESKLARAVDVLDVIIHELDNKKNWKG